MFVAASMRENANIMTDSRGMKAVTFLAVAEAWGYFSSSPFLREFRKFTKFSFFLDVVFPPPPLRLCQGRNSSKNCDDASLFPRLRANKIPRLHATEKHININCSMQAREGNEVFLSLSSLFEAINHFNPRGGREPKHTTLFCSPGVGRKTEERQCYLSPSPPLQTLFKNAPTMTENPKSHAPFLPQSFPHSWPSYLQREIKKPFPNKLIPPTLREISTFGISLAWSRIWSCFQTSPPPSPKQPLIKNGLNNIEERRGRGRGGSTSSNTKDGGAREQEMKNDPSRSECGQKI